MKNFITQKIKIHTYCLMLKTNAFFSVINPRFVSRTISQSILVNPTINHLHGRCLATSKTRRYFRHRGNRITL